MGSVARSGATSRDPSRLIQEVEAIVASALGFFLVLCLLSYVPESPGVNHGGVLGFTVADILIQSFGYGAYVFPGALIAGGLSLFLSRKVRLTAVRVVGAIFLLLLSSVTLGVYRPHVAPEAAGGSVGGFLATLMLENLGGGGSAVVLVSLFLLDFMMVTGHALSELIRRLAQAIDEAFETARQTATDSWRSTMETVRGTMPRLKSLRPAVSLPVPNLLRRGPAPASNEPRIVRQSPNASSNDGDNDDDGEQSGRRSSPLIEVLRPKARDKAAKGRVETAQEEFSFSVDPDNFRLPPGNLLGNHDDRSDYIDEKALVDSSAILEQKLATFGVGGRVTAVRPGPVITTYEFEPEAGVKVSRVVGLCDDLTMALRAHGVRIVAPIPGKNCVGIEVSNKSRATVRIRDLIDTNDFRTHRSLLPIALGRDTTGLPVFADMCKMPHLLMAGATGTGKSVALNAYIVSFLYKATPRDVRFIMIDPKMLELSLYEGIPHLLVPVVTDVKKAAAALANVMREMDRRFELMKDKKVRSLDDYNKRIAEEVAAAEAAARLKPKAAVVEPEETEDEEDEGPSIPTPPVGHVHEHLPRILVIIDELADLMMTVGREVETAITRLAQKARAAGIHLIVATQRPSVDVITGLIKANFPSRISFQVTSRPDSRTILDTVGADRLLGNGDALYMAPGTSHLQRLHGALITDEEIKEIVDFLRRQGAPQYRMDILDGASDGEGGGEDGEEFFDELYDRSVELVTQHGQGSTSWLQRKLGIGYNRAARIMEQMEREGVVGPGDGAKPRKVLAQAIG